MTDTTPDTTALRALADHMETLPPFVSFGGHVHPHTAQIETATVRALCDGYDEAQRLRGDVNWHRGRATALVNERDAARQALTDLIGELRGLCDRLDDQTLRTTAAASDALRAVLDRHEQNNN